MFRVGQKVVCVDDHNGDASSMMGAGYTHGLRNGSIYTITAIDGDLLCLAEIAKGLWYSCRFRPIVEKKTDISIFTAMLTPKKAKEPVQA